MSSHYAASCSVQNNSNEKLTYLSYCKGTSSDPTGGETGHLEHGKMVNLPSPSSIDPGGVSAWYATSDGSTVEGSVNFYVGEDQSNVLTCYFHVGRDGVVDNGSVQPDCTSFSPSDDGSASTPVADPSNNDYGTFSYQYTKISPPAPGSGALAGAELVLALSEKFVGNVLYDLVGDPRAKFQTLIASVAPPSGSGGSYVATPQATTADLQSALEGDSSLFGIDLTFGSPVVAFGVTSDCTVPTSVSLSLPLSSGNYYASATTTHAVTGTDFQLTLSLGIRDVTDQIKNGSFTNEPFLAELQTLLAASPSTYTLSAVYFDLPNAKVDSGTVYPSDLSDTTEQANLWGAIQVLLGADLVVGILQMVEVDKSADAPFLPTSAALSTTHASGEGSDLSSLNIVMMSQGVALATDPGTGEFADSLFANIPSQDAIPKVVFLCDYSLFQTYVVNPFLSGVSVPLSDGFPGFSLVAEKPTSAEVDWSGSSAKYIAPFTKGPLPHTGIKFYFQTDDYDSGNPTRMSAEVVFQPINTQDSTYLELSGTFQFSTPMILKSDSMGVTHHTLIDDISLNTECPNGDFYTPTFTYKGEKYTIAAGQPGGFQVKILPTAAASDSETDTGQPFSISAGNFVFECTQQDVVLGLTQVPVVTPESGWDRLWDVLIGFVIGGPVGAVGGLLSGVAAKNGLTSISIANLNDDLNAIIKQSANQAVSVLDGFGSESFLLPQTANFTVDDFNLVTMNGKLVIAASYNYGS